MKSRPIQLLTDHVANKIAAGEVVERPASVLKELIENALDAGATRIEVSIVAGGRHAIVVTDDGCGMGRDDVLLSVERHATSKIREVEDIDCIATLGFRGEALAAISSVSRFTLTSRPVDALAGTELSMAGGRILDVREVGCPSGTTIAARNLFHNVPARRRFLRSEQTELAHLRQVFLLYAISRPAIQWRLVVDEREVYHLPAVDQSELRLRELFGAEWVTGLKPLQIGEGSIRIHGFVSLPASSRGDRSDQYIFINGRPCSAPVIGYALSESYATLMPKGRHPIAVLFIELPPEEVDVNVHPTKREIRFRNNTPIRDLLMAGVRDALRTPSGAAAAPEPTFVRVSRQAPAIRFPDLPELPAFAYPRPPTRTEPMADTQADGEPKPHARDSAELSVPSAASADAGRLHAPWTWCRVLGQVGGLYVIFETEDGTIIMDPHAAHERVNYERLMGQVTRGAVASQGLLTPETVALPPAQAELVRAHAERLRAMGFGVHEFGGDSFLIDALPACLGHVAARELLGEIALNLEDLGARGTSERWAEERVAMAACKASVKANDRLTLREIEQLVLDLARCEMPYTCPHGRPTTIFLGFSELQRKFGRA